MDSERCDTYSVLRPVCCATPVLRSLFSPDCLSIKSRDGWPISLDSPCVRPSPAPPNIRGEQTANTRSTLYTGLSPLLRPVFPYGNKAFALPSLCPDHSRTGTFALCSVRWFLLCCTWYNSHGRTNSEGVHETFQRLRCSVRPLFAIRERSCRMNRLWAITLSSYQRP